MSGADLFNHGHDIDHGSLGSMIEEDERYRRSNERVRREKHIEELTADLAAALEEWRKAHPEYAEGDPRFK